MMNTPIVSQEARRRIRRPGTRRRVGAAVFFFALIGLSVGAYAVVARRAGKTESLSSYRIATIRVGPLRETISAAGILRVTHTDEVRAPHSGAVSMLYVSEGDYIKAGAPIARLESDELRQELEDTRYALERIRTEAALLSAEYSLVASIALRGIERQRNALERAKTNLEETRGLYEAGAVAAANVRQAEDLRLETELDLEEKIDRVLLEYLRYCSRANEMQENEKAAERKLKKIEQHLESLTVRSTISGVVQDLASLNQTVEPRQLISRIADLNTAVVAAYVPSRLLDLFAFGSAVNILVENGSFPGKVAAVGTSAVHTVDGHEASFAVEAVFEEYPVRILEGLPATVSVDTIRRESTLVLPRDAFYGSSRDRYLFRQEGSRAVRTDVRFGAVTESEIEVLSGVQAGDRIIISSYSGFIDSQAVELRQNERSTQ